MKTRKFGKIAAALLSLVLMLSTLSMSVFAQTSTGVFDPTITSGSLTIKKTDGAGNAITDTTLQYTIYKVATVKQTTSGTSTSMQYILDTGVTLTGGIVGNGTNVALPTGTTPADFVSGLPAGTALTNTAGTGILTFSSLPLGLYLVRETVSPAGVTQSNDFLVSIPMSETVSGNQVWNYDPVATPKNTVVDGKVSKTITGGATATGGGTNEWTASLGAELDYKVTATLPTTFVQTPYTTYKVTDTPGAGLSINLDGTGAAGSFDGIVVKVGTTTLVKGTDYTIAASGTGFAVELITAQPTATAPSTDKTTPGAQLPTLTAASIPINGAVVTITYKATMLPAGGSLANAVNVTSAYNTSGGGSVTPPTITPPPTDPLPTVVTYNYAIQKVDGSNAPLTGATFAIRNALNGKYLAWTSTGGWAEATGLSDTNLYKVTSATGPTSGIVSFNGLAGTITGTNEYEIVEISAPAGYSALTAPITVTIDSASTTLANTAGSYSMQVVNSKANTFTLPGTGGMGIYIYTIGGVLLIGTAILLFALNRKRKNSLSA